MSSYIKLFNNHTQYSTFAASNDFITPNVSACIAENEAHFNPYIPKVIAKYNVTDTSNSTKLCNSSSINEFSAIEIDGVEKEVMTEYTFDTTGEHTVEFILVDPTSMGDGTFTSCTSLTSINIPIGITSIGNYAFAGCSNLTSIFIPDNVTNINDGAFIQCSSLTNIVIPDSVTSIGGSVFQGCNSLTSVTIGNSVTNIGNNVFYNCTSLTSIDVPDSVTSIGESALQGCTSLTSCTIGSGVTSIGDNAFRGCSSLASIVSNAMTAPTVTGTTFVEINTGGTLIVPSGSVGYNTWMNTSNYLGKYNWIMVDNPLAETKLVVYYDIQDISNPITVCINNDDSIKSMEIDGNVIVDINTQDSDDKDVKYQFDSVGEHIIKYRFNNPTKVGNAAPLFIQLSTVKKVIIPDSATSIGDNVFLNCIGLTNITIGNSITSIGRSAFQNCSGLTSIVIPNSVTSIGMADFMNCTSLTNITIGSGVTSIGQNAFSDCSNLSTITSYIMHAPNVNPGTFINVSNVGTLYVPNGSDGYDTWMNDSNLGYDGNNWTKVEQ